MEYRLAKREDLVQLASLRRELWLDDDLQDNIEPAQQDQAEFVDDFVAWLEDRLGSSWFAWCAVDDGAIVAQIYIQRVEKLPKPSAPRDAFGYVTSVYTKPSFRDRGIGTRLLTHVERWALDADLEFLVLWPSDASQAFWVRGGFSANASLQLGIRPYVN